MPKEFVREPFRVSLISGMENLFASEGYVTILDFLSKFFCLAVPKNFVGGPFCAVFHKIFGSEKFMHRSGVEYQDLLSKIICFTLPKNFVGEPFRVSLISGSGKVYEKEGEGVTKSTVENFLFQSAEKFRVGAL